MQKIAIPNGSGQGTYINLHSKTDIMHRLSAGICHMQISSELLSNQTFLKSLNFAQQSYIGKWPAFFYRSKNGKYKNKNVLKKSLKGDVSRIPKMLKLDLVARCCKLKLRRQGKAALSFTCSQLHHAEKIRSGVKSRAVCFSSHNKKCVGLANLIWWLIFLFQYPSKWM